MEKEIELGKIGALKIDLAAGKASVSIMVQEQVLEGAVAAQAQAGVVVDASVLVDVLFALIEAKSPAGAVAIEESVKSVIKSAVAAIQ